MGVDSFSDVFLFTKIKQDPSRKPPTNFPLTVREEVIDVIETTGQILSRPNEK